MTKLSEVLATKAGNWYQVGDVINVPLTITEDVGAAYDIRLDKEEKYYCIQCSNGTEVKDLHVAKGALRAIAEIMPQSVSWKGQKFQINAVTGKGFSTKTHVSLLVGDYNPAAQQRLPVTSAVVDFSSPLGIAPDPKAMAVVAVIEALRDAMIGVHETRLEGYVRGVLTSRGMIESVSETISRLKTSSRVHCVDGVWKVVS